MTEDCAGAPPVELTILMPCLDEAETVATCIRKALGFLEEHDVSGEVLIADNGSTDGSQRIAIDLGARVVDVPERGYGAALIAGIEGARGTYVIMGDADNSYDFSSLRPFLDKLREGWQLVMGNRFTGGIAPRAMPPLHKYLGNPVLSGIGRLLFPSPVGDFHCGLRGFCADDIRRLRLRTHGMEFASEMVVKSTLAGLRVTEVPTMLSPDGRSRAPHLRSWRDGWRHLRFMLIYSPSWLFLFPGLALIVAGSVGVASLATGDRAIAGITFGITTLLYSALALIIGVEAIGFARFLKYLGTQSGELPPNRLFAGVERVLSLERTLAIGLLFGAIGMAGSLYALSLWSRAAFGTLSAVAMMRVTIPTVTFLIVGVQFVFSAFFMYALRQGPGHHM